MAQQPSLQTIRFRIRADGRVEETVEGLQGDACERLTEQIEARLGTVQQRQPTAEAFQAAALNRQRSERLEATSTTPLP